MYTCVHVNTCVYVYVCTFYHVYGAERRTDAKFTFGAERSDVKVMFKLYAIDCPRQSVA